MKFRSLLLFACMVFVPLMAMFSHKIPSEFREALRQQLWTPARQALVAALDLEPAVVDTHASTHAVLDTHASTHAVVDTHASTHAVSATHLSTHAVVDSPLQIAPAATIVMPAVTLAPIDAIAPPTPAVTAGLAMPATIAASVPTGVTQHPQHHPEAPLKSMAFAKPSPHAPSARMAPEPADPASRLPVAHENLASAHRTIENRLNRLGAIGFECSPHADGDKLHRCSCRVSADPSGQLQRVFQSAHVDPITAMQDLLGQVRSWKHRIASQPSSSPPPQTPPGQTVRF